MLLREPKLSDRDFLALGRSVMELAQRFPGSWVGVHDRVHVARELDADGVHLGFRSLPMANAREQLPETCAIGFSGHAADSPEAWEGADYLCFGPVNDTPSKRDLLEPTGFEGLREAANRTETPLFALGGMTAADVAPAIAAGAAGVAVLSGVLGAADVRGAVCEYLAALAAVQVPGR